MIGSSKLTTFVLAPLLIGCICWTSSVSGQGCTTTEQNTIRSCITTYGSSLSTTFGTGGTCNRTLMTSQVCSKYGDIVTCVNNASLSSTTCRPYMVSQTEADLGISCKLNDFVVTCTSAPQLNQGSPSLGCNLTELNTIWQCISPYSNQFISSFKAGATCNRALITPQVCSNYGTIVTCVNSASLSNTTCRPYMVSQIDAELVISCKVNDFAGTCTNATKLNEGIKSGASCLSNPGAHTIFVAMVTHVILSVFAFPVKNS